MCRIGVTTERGANLLTTTCDEFANSIERALRDLLAGEIRVVAMLRVDCELVEGWVCLLFG